MLTPCRDLPVFPRFLRQVQTIDVSTNAKFKANYPRICHELGGRSGQDVSFTDRTKLPPAGPLPHKHRMPYRPLGEKFIGRVDSFWSLHDSLFRDDTTICRAKPSSWARSALARHSSPSNMPTGSGAAIPGGVYWVDADQGLSTLISQIGEAAGIEVDNKADQARQLEQIWRGLNQMPGPALLVLDNFRRRKRSNRTCRSADAFTPS